MNKDLKRTFLCVEKPLSIATLSIRKMPASLLWEDLLFADGKGDVGALKIEEGRPLALHEVDVSFSSFRVGKVDH